MKAIAIAHVTVIDMTGAPPKADMTAVLVGDQISELGPAVKVKVPSGAGEIDGHGKFLIPGLWDMHVHTIGPYYLGLYVANGVVGVRDMGNYAAQIKPLRQATAEGKMLGPEIVCAGPIVDGPKPIWPFSIPVANAEQGRQAVKTIKDQGLDFVKVYSLLPRDGYFAIADEAKKEGIPFAGHTPMLVSAAEVSNAGQKSIEHLTGVLVACSSKEAEFRKRFVDAGENGAMSPSELSRRVTVEALDSYDSKKADALFKLFARNHTWQCPTLTVLRSFAYLDQPEFRDDSRVKYMPAFFKQFWDPKYAPSLKNMTREDFNNQRLVYAKQLQIVGAMHRDGVKIIAGTDTTNSFVFPGFSLHDELALLVKAGLTPMEALQSATRDAAEYLDRLDQEGTVEKGKKANLLLLDANPLDDINNTKTIDAVILRGHLHPKVELDEILAKQAAAQK
ncbi:MAG TPA: amidohydrolase family protein [Blastocatellia bacterium]|nr:amidohydrolase family protein [Blastocatellia bacterium]